MGVGRGSKIFGMLGPAP